jgi:hypothetical protein
MARPLAFAVGHVVTSGAGAGKTADSTPVTKGKEGARSTPRTGDTGDHTTIQ